MGKIQKLRQQKKLEEEIEQMEKFQRNKKIAVITFLSLAAVGILIFGIVKFLNWKIDASRNSSEINSSTITPTPTPRAENLFPSLSPAAEQQSNMDTTSQYALIETARGNIKLELYSADAPKTVANFISLINKGFYNGLKFHRVISDFMIQGGDPRGDGTGGPGYSFEDEMNPWSLGLPEATIQAYEAQGYQYTKNLTSHKMTVGALAMANAGPNTNGSQFFIVTQQDQPHLDGKHTVFGRVAEGMDVVRQIQQGDVMNKVTIIK
jgi:peptidyl-prolyl cis-trans isomerase B (cyclophilin B)